MKMKNKINHFLIASLIAVCIVCIGVFAILATYINKQNNETVSQLGNIYMSNMNNRIIKHYDTMTEHRMSQLESLAETIPPEYINDENALNQWLVYNVQTRGFDAAACCYSDGEFEMLYGDGLTPSDPELFLDYMKKGTKRLAIGYNSEGEQVILTGVPLTSKIPGKEDCIALVGELPISYIADTLSLEEKNSLIYSFVIRADGGFVIRTNDAYRENYFDRVESIYEDWKGKSRDDYLTELKAAIAADVDYSAIIQIKGERRHVYCSSLPNSVWYLVTMMPYGALNESVETLGTRSLIAALSGCAAILIVVLIVFFKYFRMNREQMQELEEAREMAVNASKSKSEFLSNMSHDIRTPMNAIMGMTAIATANMNNPQQVQNCLKKITLSSRHLLGLINDVLDMSKIESGRMTLNIERISLREVMDGIVSIVQPQVKSKHQHFHVSIYNIMSENIQCDGVRLNQVMLNLLSNAIKFTPEGGRIEVTLHEEVSPKGGDYVRIRIHVKDNGIGISEEFQAQIFESFSREDSKRVHRTEGTGLGMAITKYIVDAMGGEISVSSKQGVGTEFQVVLDFERAEEVAEDMILPDWNMLVVDDDQQLCETTVASLKSIGIRAEWVLDGETAVRVVTQHHREHADYHIILLDWKLPDMDGIETARELRKQLGDDVPIILISAYDWTEIEEEARAAGINGFLMKPLFRSTLFYGLRTFIDNDMPQPVFEEDTTEFTNRRILIAEDNELNWEIACELLQDLGLELEWAENGQVCTNMFRESEPGYYDAILMDIRMPIMNGYEATEIIRAMNRSDASLPIIAMTADAFSEDIQRCMEHGMNAHIAKPIDVKDVGRVLKHYLED